MPLSWRSLLHKRNEQAKAAVDLAIDERVDPEVQMHQVEVAERDNHRSIVSHASNVISNQKLTEMNLHQAIDEETVLESKVKRTLIKIDQLKTQFANATDENERARLTGEIDSLTRAAKTFAVQLQSKRAQVASLKQVVEQTTQAAHSAHEVVASSTEKLQRDRARRQNLHMMVDQAKMQEAINADVQGMNAAADADVPTMDEVEQRIKERYARALGTTELSNAGPEHDELLADHAVAELEADDLLDQFRGELGISTASAITAPAPAALEPAS